MKIRFCQFLVTITALLAAFNAQAAADSYRFLHVTIETPWAIFIFLLGFILIPFILMAMLYWYFAFKKTKEDAGSGIATQQTTVEEPSEKSTNNLSS